MAKKIYSATFSGLKCHIVEVEAEVSNGLPNFTIVGLGDASVQESKERVRSGIKNSGATFPSVRKTINLAPAQIKKQGSLFDLPIAAGILYETDQISADFLEKSLIIGELSLTGNVKPVKGILPITQYAKEKNFSKIFLPVKNAKEAAFIKGIDIYPLNNLREFIDHCNGTSELQKYSCSPLSIRNKKPKEVFDEIIGNETAKRALIISAAGSHNILFTGSPGSGKTVLARELQKILPVMSLEEQLQTTKIYSIAGRLPSDCAIISKRPFREVHHTASMISIIGGGGVSPNPGEISLAHNGVLFFDEINEFPQKILESLRQPLEDNFININRANFSARFPSNFIFIATRNPCPCGYLLNKKQKCSCSQIHIDNYQKKLSGPLLDRFDIFLNIESVKMVNNMKKIQGISPHEQIRKAREIQEKRFQKERIIKNSDMTLNQIVKHCQLDKEAHKLLKTACDTLNLSNRAYLKTLKLARTIADLDGSENIDFEHIAESLRFREEKFFYAP